MEVKFGVLISNFTNWYEDQKLYIQLYVLMSCLQNPKQYQKCNLHICPSIRNCVTYLFLFQFSLTLVSMTIESSGWYSPIIDDGYTEPLVGPMQFITIESKHIFFLPPYPMLHFLLSRSFLSCSSILQSMPLCLLSLHFTYLNFMFYF